MTQGPLLLTDRVVPAPAQRREHPTEAEARRTIAALNPRFVASAGLVPLAQSDGRLTVGMAREPTREVGDALRFATGLEIEFVTLTPEQLGALRPLDTAANPSRFEAIRSRFAGVVGRWRGAPTILGERLPALRVLARLVEAGHSVRSAARTMLDASDNDTEAPAHRFLPPLADGGSLAGTACESELFPPYMRRAFTACRDADEQARALVSLAAYEADRARARERGVFAVAEAAVLWTIATLLWVPIALWAAVPVMVAGVIATVRLRELTAPGEPGSSQRAAILELVGRLAGIGLSPRHAIQAAMALLGQLRPTWGALPDTRDALADALGSTPLQRALLTGGELADRAVREAERQRGLADAAIERIVRLSRIGAIAFAGSALVIHVG